MEHKKELDTSIIKMNQQIEELRKEGNSRISEFEESIGEICNLLENLKIDVNLNRRKEIWI